jgi:hypothetical protein
VLGNDPGNAILLNGVFQIANREIGVPGLYYKNLLGAVEQNRIGASSRPTFAKALAGLPAEACCVDEGGQGA